jgi:uncharacterized protein DUF4919
MIRFSTQFPLALAGAFLLLAAISSRAADATDVAYKQLVARVVSGDLSVDFRTLRMECLKAGKACDASGPVDDMTAMQRAMHDNKYDKAVIIGEDLIDRGFVNIAAHGACAKAYDALHEIEKAKFHRSVTSALIRSIMISGDGKSKESAFEVISSSEEYIAMQVLGLNDPASLKQSLISEKSHSYDRLEESIPGRDDKAVVFFNIDAFYPAK